MDFLLSVQLHFTINQVFIKTENFEKNRTVFSPLGGMRVPFPLKLRRSIIPQLLLCLFSWTYLIFHLLRQFFSIVLQ